jgi:hypothetical protein
MRLLALGSVSGRAGKVAAALFAAVVIGLPLLLMTAVVSVVGSDREAAARACASTDIGAGNLQVGAGLPAGLTPGARARFYEPLRLEPGRWYRTGATRFYNAPGDATGTGSIPDPAQRDLMAHPNTFAELSLATRNPANYRDFLFEDANALGRLPYMTALLVANDGHSVIVYKRDVGYGLGTDVTADGERYRLDLWGPAADAIDVSKTEVRIALAPRTGAGPVLGDTPETTSLTTSAAVEAVPDARGGPGFTPALGTDFLSGQEPEIARRADALGKALGIALTGVSGRRTPEHNRAVGGATGSKHLTGEAADIDGLQTVAEETLNRYGLTRPVAHYVDGTGREHDERNHVALLEGSGAPIDSGLSEGCLALPAAQPVGGPLPLTPGQRARLLPNGLAAAPEQAPKEVKALIAAGNELVGKPYVYGGGHGLSLGQIAPAYDCSSSLARLLYQAGLFDTQVSPTSDELAEYGAGGYGRWVSVLANSDHAYAYIAGLRWDTHAMGSGDRGNTGIGWHTARRDDTTFTARHPNGL